MRKVFLFGLLLAAQYSIAQKTKTNNQGTGDCPRFYLGLNTGLENPNGIIGLSFDMPIVEHVSGRAGVGLSSWGYKFYGEGVGYLSECHRGLAAGVGVSRNTGLSELKTKVPTTAGDQDVTFQLLPQTNLFFNLYYYFNVGKKGNRFYLQTGYSIPLSDKAYNIKSGHTLTDDGETAMKVLRPGGLSLGLGFYFNVSGSGK